MIERPNVLYTAEATATGGREGHVRTSDGRVDVDLDVPQEMGGEPGPGTNPEQLLAAGWAACFQSALLRFAAGRNVDVGDSRLTARIGIDTADAYGPDVSEELIAEALFPYEGLLIATKGGYERTGPSGRTTTGELTGWTPNGRPDHLRAACEASLNRLRLDRIDLYQLHTPDPAVP